MAAKVDELLAAAEALSPQERQQLLRRLTERVGTQAPAKRRSILELKGVGAEIWRGMDVDAYINAERDSWDSERT